MTTKLITGESSAFIKKVSSGDLFYACITGWKLHLCWISIQHRISLFSDNGILMTFGSGLNGCLGYGNYDDASEVHNKSIMYVVCSCELFQNLNVYLRVVITCILLSLQPKLVPAMLDYETVEVACGDTHVVAVTGTVFLRV